VGNDENDRNGNVYNAIKHSGIVTNLTSFVNGSINEGLLYDYDLLFLLPQQSTNLSSKLTDGDRLELHRWVYEAGGVILALEDSSYNAMKMMNSLFSLSWASSGYPAGSSPGTLYATATGIPATLPVLHSTWSIANDSLSISSGTECVYATDAKCIVTLSKPGTGQIAHLGYDYASGADASWDSSLDLAVRLLIPIGYTLPNPTSYPTKSMPLEKQ